MQGHFDGLFLYEIPEIIWVDIKTVEKDILENKNRANSEPLLASTRNAVDESLT